MAENNYQSEIEKNRRYDREAMQRAYENIRLVLEDKRSYDGINAVLSFFHEKNYVNEELPLSEQIEEIERGSNIKIRYVELEDDWYETTVIPILLKTADGRNLAAIPKINGSCYYIENGKKITITKERAKQFEKDALCFYRSTSEKKVGFKDFAVFILKSITTRDALTILISCVLAVAAGLMLPWVNGFIFSRVVPAGDWSAVIPTAALLFSAVSIAAVMKLMQSQIISNTMQRADIHVQSAVFSRLLSIKPEFFKKIKAGELSRMILESMR